VDITTWVSVEILPSRRASNNLLKHIAAMISPWIDILAGQLKDWDCSLSIGDSTMPEGWL
jgi:hypothetical protein